MSESSLLVVDDDQELLDSYSRWFTRRGFQVTAAHHPRLALAAAAYNNFDAALIDVTLPEMNGLELVDKLKRICEFPVIVLSGDDNPKLRDAAIERGVYRLLLKPTSIRAVEEAIRESICDWPNLPANQRATKLESAS
jgi:DNA-binding response OmpR family regulator